MSELIIKKQRENILSFLIRDGLAAQAFFGNTEGMSVYLGDMATSVSPVVKYFLEERHELSIKSALYLDASMRLFNEMLMLYDYGGNVKFSFFSTFKLPLMIPAEIRGHIVEAIPKLLLSANTKEDEEALSKIETVFEILDLYTEKPVGEFVSYIAGEGILDTKSLKKSFRKIRENKDEVERAFRGFVQTLIKHKDLIERLSELCLLDDVLKHFSDTQLLNVPYDLNFEETQRIDSLMAHTDGGGCCAYVKGADAGEEDFGIPFSLFSSSRPRGSRSKKSYIYSLCDLLLYTEKALKDEQARQIMEAIRLYDSIVNDEKREFDKIFDEIALVGDRYDEAYEYAVFVSDDQSGGEGNVAKSVQLEGYIGFATDFINSFKSVAQEQFSLLLDREAEKKPDEGSLFVEDERYAFLSALYVIETIFKQEIVKLPMVDDSSRLKDKFRIMLKQSISEMLPDMVSGYNRRRKAYLDAFVKEDRATEEAESQHWEEKSQTATDKAVREDDTISDKEQTADQDTSKQTVETPKQEQDAEASQPSEVSGDDNDDWEYADEEDAESEDQKVRLNNVEELLQ